jgi:hypothetical protein
MNVQHLYKEGVMKTGLLTVLLCSCIGADFLYGQQSCGSLNGTVEQRRNSYASQVGFNTETQLAGYDLSVNGEWKTVGLALHIVRYTNESGAVAEGDLQQGLQLLQTAFNQARINFVVVIRDTISNDLFTSGGLTNEESMASIYNIQNVVNIYYLPNAGEPGIAPFSPPVMAWLNVWHDENCARYGQYIIINNSNAGTPTVPHEMGHFFDLFHTHERNLLGEETIPYQSGDMAPDTPPTSGANHGCNDPSPTEQALARNLMSGPPTGTSGDCRQEFTTIQIRRIRYALLTRRESYIRTSISLTNKINTQNAGGTLSVAQLGLNQQTSSGGSLWLVNNQTATAKTNTERFTNFQGSGLIHKHRDWNENATFFRLEKNFQVQPNADQNAGFRDLHSAVLQTQLLDGGTGGQIQFRDPWYLHSNNTQPDSFFTYTPGPNGFSPTGAYNQSTGGVFLNQDPAQGSPVYYSVRAAQAPQVNGLTWYFQNWTSTNVDLPTPSNLVNGYYETPAIFRSGASRSLTATYKAHRGSSLSTATQGNGQRKLIKTIDNGDQLVYPSAGQIYYTSYLPGGGVLVPDQKISNSNGTAAFPALAYNEGYNRLYAVWQQVNGGSYEICFSRKTGSSWSTPVVIGTCAYSTTFNPQPVVSYVQQGTGGIAYDQLLVVWNSSTGTLGTTMSGNGGTSWNSQANVTGSGTMRPSLAPPLYYYSPSWGMNMTTVALASDDNNAIYLRTYHVWGVRVVGVGVRESSVRIGFLSPCAKTTTSPWSNPEQIPGSYSSSGIPKKANAVHSSSNGRIFVAWHGYMSSHNVSVASKHMPTGNWSAVTCIIPAPYSADYAPSISVLASGTAAVAFTNVWNNTVSVYKILTNGTVTFVENQSTARHPQVATAQQSPSNARYVTTRTTGVPYEIRTDGSPVSSLQSDGNFLAKSESEEVPLEYVGRAISAFDTLTGEWMQLEIQNPRVGSAKLDFVAVNDTMPDWSVENPWAYLSTLASSAVGSKESLHVEIRFSQSGRAKAPVIDLMDGENARAYVRLTELAQDTGTVTKKMKVNLRGLSGKQLKLSVTRDNEGKKTITFIICITCGGCPGKKRKSRAGRLFTWMQCRARPVSWRITRIRSIHPRRLSS